VVRYNEGQPSFALVLAASLGVSRAYPEMELQSLLNAEGTAALATLKKPVPERIRLRVPEQEFSEFTKPEYSEPLSLPQVAGVLADDSLAKATPDAPISCAVRRRRGHPGAGVDKLANYYCSAGSK